MKSSTRSLTEGPLAKQILLVSLPLALSNLLQVLFNMSDVAVVGRFAGSTALGAVGSTSIFVTLFTGFLIGLGNGINVLVARFYGARHPNDVHDTVHSALIVSLIAGVILLVVGLLGSPAMLRLLNTKEDLLPGAILYLRVYFLGMPALALYNFGNAVFSAIGETKKPLYILSFAGVLNILLNLFFVIVCNLDVAGVALASAISQCVSAGLILHALTRVQDCYALHFTEAKLDPAMTKSILALGLPAGFQNAIFAIANLFIQAGVNSTANSGTTWDLTTTFPTAEDLYNEMHDAYDGDVAQYWSIEGIGRTDMLAAVQNSLVREWAPLDDDWRGGVQSVSGVKKVDDRTIRISLTRCDDTILKTLTGICIAPLHVYGDVSLFDPDNDSFGFTKGDLSSVRANNGKAVGAGEYAYRETDLRTVYLDANENYWLGVTDVPEIILSKAE